MQSNKITIIGAGLSGLACARRLQNAGREVVVLEKSRSLGGRCATRKWGDHVVDHGAQYFTVVSPEFRDELDQVLDSSAMKTLEGEVVDAGSGRPVPSKGGARHYYAPGNNRIGAALARGIEVRRECLVESLEPLLSEASASVVVTCPWPQAAALLGRDGGEVPYVPCLTGFFEYAGEPAGLAATRYAVMASSGDDPLAWSACENWKSGRIAGGKTVMVVQMSERFSRQHYGSEPEAWLTEARGHLERRWEIGTCLENAFAHRWGYARVARGATPLPPGDVPGLPGVYLAGDATASSRVEAAWLSGLRVADTLLQGTT